MKKIIIFSIITLFLLSGLQAVAFTNQSQQPHFEIENFVFSSLKVTTDTVTTSLTFNEATTYAVIADNYLVPAVTKTYTFPAGTSIDAVTVTFTQPTELQVTQPLKQASDPIPDDYQGITAKQLEYSASTYSDDTPYSYSIATGRSGDKLVCYVSIKLLPVLYNPSEKTVSYSDMATVSIEYIPPTSPVTLEDDYELLIIAPSKFAGKLQSLADHKDAHGISTIVVTLDEIYTSEYFPVEGRDCAEEIKYFIQDALDEWGIKYVLLAGGRKGGVMEETWWVPVRYSNLDDGGEGSYLTDLYFADIYDNSMEFSTWDSNDNGVFAEWKGGTKDIIDMYPEVFVGRLAVRSPFELSIVINKIIKYENEAYGNEWVKKFVGVAGDTYPSAGDPYFEGELATEAAFEYIEPLGFESSFMWTSNGRVDGKQSVIDEITLGCGFLHFSGHGNPNVWSNHPPNDPEAWVDGPSSFDMVKMRNKEMLPVTIVGGCHNAQYNVSLLNILKGILEHGSQYFSTEESFGDVGHREWVPRCWAWAMANKNGGGCIAIIANTGLGYGASGEEWNQRRGRVMEMNFFRSYSDGYENLGETHGMDVIYFMNDFPPMDDQIDCKIAQQWALLGDPSLLIGGYSS